MSTIHFHETTTATPEQFVAAITDFGPGRSELFGNSADGHLKVHDQIRDLDSNKGQYDQAVQTAIGDKPDGAAATFAKLDDNLQKAMK